MITKPSVVKGTRDFLPEVTAKRQYIFDTIKSIFQIYGFSPIETPTMETTQTLLGKYGEEGDRLIFRVLHSGDKIGGADIQSFQQGKFIPFVNSLSDKALRYDLTVPFARFVVQHQNDLSFPFKRYQIQPVWRADRPQKGRYREFYQCDVDVVGSDSLLYEIELIQIFDEVLSKLGLIDFTVKINNRKILSGIAEICGESEKIVDITVAIDKLDKIGKDGVVKELKERGISDFAIEKIDPLFHLNGNNNEKIEILKSFLKGSEVGMKGIEELEFIFHHIDNLGLDKAQLSFEVTLARGLNYYTGAIFEVSANNVKMGSICGGGRYDNLTELFGLSGMSGVGISFGADRIYDVMEELNLFPSSSIVSTHLLFINFGEKEQNYCLNLIKEIRKMGISTEIYPESAKMKKQMKYADDKKIPYVALVGESEMENNIITLKNMSSGEQVSIQLNDLIQKLKN